MRRPPYPRPRRVAARGGVLQRRPRRQQRPGRLRAVPTRHRAWARRRPPACGWRRPPGRPRRRRRGPRGAPPGAAPIGRSRPARSLIAPPLGSTSRRDADARRGGSAWPAGEPPGRRWARTDPSATDREWRRRESNPRNVPATRLGHRVRIPYGPSRPTRQSGFGLAMRVRRVRCAVAEQTVARGWHAGGASAVIWSGSGS